MVRRLHPAVFLDRDGVLNEAVVRDGKPFPPASVESTVIYPHAAACVAALRDAGFVTVMVTNQPDVAKGTQSKQIVDSINALVFEATGLDAIKVCWCLEGEGCDCYKPKPGMLLEAARELRLDLAKSYMIGDRWRDVGAGINAGCRTVLIDRGYNEKKRFIPDHVEDSFPAAIEWILHQSRH